MSSDMGKNRRLQRIFSPLSQKTIIVPLDHGVTQGPIQGLTKIPDLLTDITKGGANAIIGHIGIPLHYSLEHLQNLAFILHLNGNTTLSPHPNQKIVVNSVQEALRIGAEAVSFHVNVGIDEDTVMLAELGKISRECREWGMPLIAMMYPRGKQIPDEHHVDVVKHVARLGAELGADIVKTNYTGDPDSFKEVVQGCHAPIIIAGGPLQKTKDLLIQTIDAISVGAAGISYGRNIFQHSHPQQLTHTLNLIVHQNYSIEDAINATKLKIE